MLLCRVCQTVICVVIADASAILAHLTTLVAIYFDAVMTNVSLSNKPFHFSSDPYQDLGMSNGVFTAAG